MYLAVVLGYWWAPLVIHMKIMPLSDQVPTLHQELESHTLGETSITPFLLMRNKCNKHIYIEK